MQSNDIQVLTQAQARALRSPVIYIINNKSSGFPWLFSVILFVFLLVKHFYLYSVETSFRH